MRVLVTTDIPQHHDYASLPATLVPHMACTSSSLPQAVARCSRRPAWLTGPPGERGGEGGLLGCPRRGCPELAHLLPAPHRRSPRWHSSSPAGAGGVHGFSLPRRGTAVVEGGQDGGGGCVVRFGTMQRGQKPELG